MTTTRSEKAGTQRVAVGADQRGRTIAGQVVEILHSAGYEVVRYDDWEDASPDVVESTDDEQGEAASSAASDYPERAWLVAGAVARGEADWGVLVSGSGIGMCITANKVAGVRAVLAHDEWIVRRARAHHNCNVMCIAADLVGLPFVKMVLETWMRTEFDAGRHDRRVRKIAAVERGVDPRQVNHNSD